MWVLEIKEMVFYIGFRNDFYDFFELHLFSYHYETGNFLVFQFCFSGLTIGLSKGGKY